LACVAAARGDDGQWNVAIAEYRRAIQAMPPALERRDAWYSLGYGLRRRGDVRGALDAFERAAARMTSHADLVAAKGVRSGFRRALLMTYAEVGTPAGAFEAFQRVSDDPGSSREAIGAMADLATEYVRLGRTREAVAALRELVARDPAQHWLWIERLGALDGQTTAPDCKAPGR
jgi:tetratricopeptide (TPR) repeat protein